MGVAINIQQLLNGKVVGWGQQALKCEWNPENVVFTGFPKIYRAINPVSLTDDHNAYFLTTLHIHPAFIDEKKYLTTIGKELDENESFNNGNDCTKDCTKELTERQKVILEIIRLSATIALPEIAHRLSLGIRTIKTEIKKLQNGGILTREGGRKEGKWIIQKQAITDDKQAITDDKQAIKPSDKIFALKGISSKTRDNLIKIIDYMKLHPSVKNAEISVLLNLGYDRSRLLLTTLVNEGILTSSGKNKDRIYSLV